MLAGLIIHERTQRSSGQNDRTVGDCPGDLPFERPTRYEMVVNLKTPKMMGLNISESFLLIVDEVIE